MKKSLIVLILSLSFICVFCDINIVSSVKDVELYPDMGKVTRKGVLKTTQAGERLIFENIPLSADIDSFTFSVSDIEVLNIYFEKQMEDNKEFSSELEVLYKEKRVIENDINMQNKINDLLNKALFSENIRFEPGENFISLIDKVEKRMSLIMEKKDELNKRLDEINRKINIINSKKNSSKVRYFYNAVLDTNGIKAGKDIEYTISYVVKNCGWKPEYSVNADSRDSKINFKYKAQIYQNTGEDWKNAQIVLSTSRPSVLRNIPVVSAWNIYVNQPVMYNSRSAMKKTAPSAMFDSLVELEMSEEADGVSALQNKVTENFLGYSFNVGRLSVNDGETGKKINIEENTLDAELEFLLIPYVMKESLLTGVFTNNTKMPFLDGQALVFLDSDYRGKQNIRFTAVDDTIEISFGNYPELSCTREKIKDKKREIGIISKSNVREMHYKTTIKNRSSRKLDVNIKERIPVSQDAKIIVKTDYTKKGLISSKENIEKGMLDYNITVESGRDEELFQNISVEYPSNIDIGGL